MSNRNKKYYQTLFLLLTIVLLTAYCLPLNATIRFVSKTGNSTPPYLTWETAADSLQKCINISVFGDTIYVANGVYEEQVVMIPGLSLIGAGMDSCVIYLSATGIPAVQIKDTCLLKGFKILLPNILNTWGIQADQNGFGSVVTLNKIVNASHGMIIRYSNPTIYNNIFENIKMKGTSLFTSNSVIRKNFVYTDPNQVSPTGIYIDAIGYNYFPIIDSNYIEITPGGVGIQKYIDSSPTIKNNVILLKGGGRGIFSNVGGISKIYNNLIIAEQSGYQGIDKVSQIEVINNHIIGPISTYGILAGPNDIIKNNVVTESNSGIESSGIQNLPYLQYNNSWNNGINYAAFTPDTSNLSVDPMIVNDDTTQGELDFHLQRFSPLIDAGDPNILDKDGSRSDIGLYGGPYGESYLYQDLAPKPPRGLFADVDTSLITLTWQRNTEADFSHYNLYRDTTNNFIIDSTKLVASLTDSFYLQSIPIGVNRLYFKLTGVDNQSIESNPSEEVAVILVSVKNEWKPINNYIFYQNYPNPFNPSTKIGYKLKERAYVKLYVYDVKGELVEVLVNQYQEAGYYEVEFNGDGKTDLIKVKNPFVSGVYLCQIIIQSENGIPVFSDMIKMILLK